MGLRRTTDATTEPLTLEQAKAHLKVDGDDDDTYISALIVAARQYVEDYTGRALITQTWKVTADRFPLCDAPLPLGRVPFQSVTSIVYTDEDGDEQTVSGQGTYRIRNPDENAPAELLPIRDESWPDVLCDEPDAVVVTFVAGYGDTAASVPSPLIHAMRLLIGHWYENREAVVTGTITAEVPMGVKMMLAPYRVWEVA